MCCSVRGFPNRGDDGRKSSPEFTEAVKKEIQKFKQIFHGFIETLPQ